ncbi:hypothetical protein BESB_044850 [Besnoitia besnoiti]|uniref:P-type ATPase A domain-containing protein n=1 Tax=Besnoitia besnoiti TaxID=94643 RepID=A0A2A9MKT0_BESBE|nr:hypothetical protein BESB_044850 [Besnoitia besnoiti]PFH36293.1 hypothetical protein BESB_044850 [Besnoitia besnoiti]
MTEADFDLKEVRSSSASASVELRVRRFVLYRKKPWLLRTPAPQEISEKPPESAGEKAGIQLSGGASGETEGQAAASADASGAPPPAEGKASTTTTTEPPKSIEELFPTLTWLFSSFYFLYCILCIFLGGLLHLSTHWFVSLDCVVGFSRASIQEATHVLVVPPSGKPLEHRTLCSLARLPDQICFFYRKKKFLFVPSTGIFQPLRFPKDRPLVEYLKWKGLDATAPPSPVRGEAASSPVPSSALPSSGSGKPLLPDWNPSEDSAVPVVQAKYGSNDYDIPIPTFRELFKEHAVSPFFVFQMLCVSLWLIDEYWQYSLFTLVMLVLLECQMVKKRLKDFQQLRAMRIPPRPVHVFRSGAWIPLRSDLLLPGDIIAITGSSKPDAAVCPVDALLLQGSAVVNEATLTGAPARSAEAADLQRPATDEEERQGVRVSDADGAEPRQKADASESIPQTKAALELDDCVGETHSNKAKTDKQLPEADEVRLDMESRNKQNVIFAGTSVILHRNEHANFLKTKVPEKGCVAYVLRTAFSTTQGKLVRTILFSHGRVTVACREAWYFLGLLLMLALCASAYVLREGIRNADRSRFKLFLSCSHIVMAVVPAEFPITLSLAVTMSLLFLFTQKIFCTEPFRVPYAGRVDVCAFDKTGTLTSDSMRVRGIYGACASSPRTRQSASQTECVAEEETLLTQCLPFETVAVVGSCHALALVDGQLLGDPLEKAAFTSVGWTLASPDCALSAPRPRPLPTSSSTQQTRISVVRRFPFSSVLQRMTVVARLEGARMPWCGPAAAAEAAAAAFASNAEKVRDGPSGVFVASKGSPEMMKNFLKDVPPFYDSLYTGFCMKGYRVLTLAYREAESNLAHAERWELEKDLVFAGFLVVTCPIKAGTKTDIDIVSRAGHRAIMVTGDSPLTACQVAIDVGIFREGSTVGEAGFPENGAGRGDDEKEQELELKPLTRPVLILKCGKSADEPSAHDDGAATPGAAPAAAGLRQRRSQPSRSPGVASASPLAPALENFYWESRDGQMRVSLLSALGPAKAASRDATGCWTPFSSEGLAQLGADFHLCLTGPVIASLLEACGAETAREQVQILRPLLPYVGVFARMSPQQKELILLAFKASGLVTLMCGDGTNDVGALKAAHVGVSLLCQEANVPAAGRSRQEAERKRKEDAQCRALVASGRGWSVFGAGGVDAPQKPETSVAVACAAPAKPGVSAGSTALQKEFERRMEDIWSQTDDGPPLVRLGDASIASPFTFKGDSIRCVPLILRSGRATLVTVVMMYKLMALNSVITAFALSVLTLDGVKLGDFQTSVENVLCTVLTMLISKTRPSLEMGPCRPIASIFHPTVFLSLVLQASLHTYTLYTAWDLARALRAPDYTPNLDGHFEPNLVNSVVFLLIASMHASTFLSNYEGAPFMAPLLENRPLFVTLGFLVGLLLLLVFEVLPELNETLSLVPFPSYEFKTQIVALVFLDLGGAWLVAWMLRKIGWRWARHSARKAKPL